MVDTIELAVEIASEGGDDVIESDVLGKVLVVSDDSLDEAELIWGNCVKVLFVVVDEVNFDRSTLWDGSVTL